MTQLEKIVQASSRRGTTSLRFGRMVPVWLGLVAVLLAGSPVSAQDSGAGPPPAGAATDRTLTLAEVELIGATRTQPATVYRYLDLQPGQTLGQTDLVAAVQRLRDRGLFAEVSFYTRPGPVRGQLVLVLEVREHGLDFRWAAGNTDLDGWYLSPVMVAHDNPLGKGGLLDLQWRVGFRHDALRLSYLRPVSGDGNDYWGARLSVVGTGRPYFSDGVEYRHHVGSAGWEGVYGRRFGDHRLLEFGIRLETVDVDDHAQAVTASVDGSIAIDQDIPAAELPVPIQDAVGRDGRAIFHLDWQHDTRSSVTRAGSPVSGAWGRLKGHFVMQGPHSHPGLQGDLRLFREVPGGVLSTRLRAAWVEPSARFHDRLYLGGMYSVRGFPTHALSAPGGDTWQVSGSVEYRSRILADDRGGTRLAGLLFLDAGAGGASDQPDPYGGVAVGAGYGVRMRVWWLDWVGVDVGFPLTERPLDMRFQVTASIGWSF